MIRAIDFDTAKVTVQAALDELVKGSGSDRSIILKGLEMVFGEQSKEVSRFNSGELGQAEACDKLAAFMDVLKPMLDQKERMDKEAQEGRPCPARGNQKVPVHLCMFCLTGHMLECHHPKTCSEAKCSHYNPEQEREIIIDLEKAEVIDLEAENLNIFNIQTFFAYSVGPLAMSVCVKKELSREEIERIANRSNPTGIQSKWSISKDKFKEGNDNPHRCEKDPERLHYLLEC